MWVGTQIVLEPGGRSGGAMALGKLPVPGRPAVWITVGQGPAALVVGAGGGCLEFLLSFIFFPPLSPSLWETVRYRLKYCLKGPISPNQPTNQLLEPAIAAMHGPHSVFNWSLYGYTL